MKCTELERAVVESMLADRELPCLRRSVDFEAVNVRDRDFTGVGFLTELEPSVGLKVFESGIRLRWGKVGARLNASKVETGFLVYVDDGYVSTVEGYTYGDEWPNKVEAFELYELKPGTELQTKPRG